LKVLFSLLTVLSATVAIGFTATSVTEAASPAPTTDSAGQTPSAAWTDKELAVLRHHNKARNDRGIGDLTATEKLGEAAGMRCRETIRRWSHTRPNGKPWHTVLPLFDIGYRSAGENIAYGQPTASSVHSAWMNSSGHRGNILNGAFKNAGVGHCKSDSGRDYWVVIFTG
jgi:uncharacterized protein YkwD